MISLCSFNSGLWDNLGNFSIWTYGFCMVLGYHGEDSCKEHCLLSMYLGTMEQPLGVSRYDTGAINLRRDEM